MMYHASHSQNANSLSGTRVQNDIALLQEEEFFMISREPEINSLESKNETHHLQLVPAQLKTVRSNRIFYFPLVFFNDAKETKKELNAGASTNINKIILSYLNYSDINLFINGKVKNNQYSWEQAAQGFLLQHQFLEKAWTQLEEKLVENGFISSEEIGKHDSNMIASRLSVSVLHNADESLKAARLLVQVDNSKANEIFGCILTKPEYKVDIKKALISETQFEDFHLSDKKLEVSLYHPCESDCSIWKCITMTLCFSVCTKNECCFMGCNCNNWHKSIPLTPLLYTALTGDQETLKTLILSSSESCINQAIKKLIEIKDDKRFRQISIASNPDKSFTPEELKEATTKLIINAFEQTKNPLFLTNEYYKVKVAYIDSELMNLNTLSTILAHYTALNELGIFSLQKRSCFFNSNTYFPHTIKLIETIQAKVVTVLKSLKQEPSGYLDQLEAVIAHDLFNARHFRGGVNQDNYAWVSHQIERLQRIFSSNGYLLLES